MKKFFFTIMSLCILLAGFSAQAEDTSEGQAFVLRIWDESNTGSKYMRFDIFLGEEQQAQFLYYLGYSDLSPEDAILEVYSGKSVDQKRIEELDLLPEFGQEYSFRVVEEEEVEGGFVLETFEWEEDTEEDSVSEEASVEETIEGNFQTYYKMSDGTWKCGDYSYKYRLEISGRIPNAAVDSTFVFLSNLESITFEQAWKASGLSSSSEDYFDPEDAVLVEM